MRIAEKNPFLTPAPLWRQKFMSQETSETTYQGYTLRKNQLSGRWEILWKERKLSDDFETRALAEEWIDDQIPLHRF